MILPEPSNPDTVIPEIPPADPSKPEYAEMPDGCLTLPAGCTGIRSGAFSGCSAVILELYIPAGTAVIEEGALSGLNFLEWIEVESGNAGVTSDSGVLFDSTMPGWMAIQCLRL